MKRWSLLLPLASLLIAAVLKKSGAQEPAPEFSTDPTTLERYAGHYKSDDIPLTIRVFVKDNRLFIQATGQGELPLKARSATLFEFKAAGVEVVFASDATFTLKQGPGTFLFKKIVNP